MCEALFLPLGGLRSCEEMWKSAGFAEAFEGPVEVANRVAEP